MSTGPTGPTLPVPLNPLPLPAPFPIATLSELTSSHNAIVQKENSDRTTLNQLSTPNRENIRTTLLNWTSRGFPANFPLFSMTVNPPPVCSDGVKRVFSDYVPYLLGTTVAAKLVLLEQQLVGMKLTSVIIGNTIRIQVSSP